MFGFDASDIFGPTFSAVVNIVFPALSHDLLASIGNSMDLVHQDSSEHKTFRHWELTPGIANFQQVSALWKFVSRAWKPLSDHRIRRSMEPARRRFRVSLLW